MPDEIISDASPAGQAIDSLSAHEFAVEIEGRRANGIFRVSGLTPFKLDIKPSMKKLVRDPFKISKMVQRDPANPFNAWLRESVIARDDIVRPTRKLAIIAIDDGVEIRRWTIQGAYVGEVTYSDFNSSSNELIEETLTIYYEDVVESWGGG